MRTKSFLFFFIANMLFISTATFAQSGNFDETWKEFLENDQISNMSELIRPDKRYEHLDYAKYLLMNTNSDFCQSDVEGAEDLMAEIQTMDSDIFKSIPGFTAKMADLETEIKAYHSIDVIWKRFLETNEVMQEELEAIKATKTTCEKRTLAKYSYMTAYYHFCQGDISKSKDIFQNRTLRLTEQTSLRVRDVEGLAGEVSKMKTLYQDMARLDNSWKTYVETGVSPGFDTELPLFPCNPIPNMKEFVLKGILDACNLAPSMLEKIKQLQADSGVIPDGDLAEKIKELEAVIGEKKDDITALNTAWEAFIPDNRVKHMGQYGYEYCETEPLIRAYIMDGFAYVCEMGEDMLVKIEELHRANPIDLERITMVKISELAELTEQYQADGREIERIWDKFVADGDVLTQDYISAEFYCDNIQQVKDWTIRGLTVSCEQGIPYLERIEEFQRTFEFKFMKDVECRVQDLRLKIWDCRYEGLLKLAKIEAPDNYEERLQELMDEYGMGEEPEECSLEEQD